MKKLGIVVLMLVLMSGCSGLQVSDANSLALQIAAQRAGFYVGQKNPEIAPVAKVIAQGIIGEGSDQDMIKAALDLGITELAKQFPDDPLLESDLKLIASTLQIDLPDSKIDIEQVKLLITAFIEGLEIGASRPK